MPQIYAACLASYNAGHLHGAWIDLDTHTTGDEIREAIQAMLATSPVPGAEEWAIHDTDDIDVDSEWPDLDALAEKAELLGTIAAEYPGIDPKVLVNIADDRAAPGDDLKAIIEDMHPEISDSPATYAADWHETTGDLRTVPDDLRFHIDWQGVARDMDYNGLTFVLTLNGEILSGYDDMDRGPCIVLQSA